MTVTIYIILCYWTSKCLVSWNVFKILVVLCRSCRMSLEIQKHLHLLSVTLSWKKMKKEENCKILSRDKFGTLTAHCHQGSGLTKEWIRKYLYSVLFTFNNYIAPGIGKMWKIILQQPESFRCANLGFFDLNLHGTAKLKYEGKNENDSGCSRKVTP